MGIETLISGKNGDEEIMVDRDAGKTCSGCFTEHQREMA